MELPILEKLQKFGLNQYEAKAYTALLKIGTANAYAIAKESCIPRARIYDVLESITNRGLAMVEESSENTKSYTPVPSKVFLERMKEEWESDYEDVSTHLQELEKEEKKQEVYVFTVKGVDNITAYCRQLLKDANHHVVISVWSKMHELLLPELENCQKRGIKIAGIGHEIEHPTAGIEPHCKDKIHNTAENIPWFVLSVDSKKLLYGYSAEVDKDAFYTEDATHIYLLEEYVLHDILINRLIEDSQMEDKLTTMMADMMNYLKK